MTAKELSAILQNLLEQHRQTENPTADSILSVDSFEDLGYRYLNPGIEVKCSDGSVFQVNIMPIA